MLVLIMHLHTFSVVQLSMTKVTQPSMDTSVLGLDIGAWASYNTGTDAFEEVDFFVGYDVTEIAGIAISVGLCEYIYTAGEADTEASVYLDYSIAELI